MFDGRGDVSIRSNIEGVFDEERSYTERYRKTGRLTFHCFSVLFEELPLRYFMNYTVLCGPYAKVSSLNL